MLEVGLASLVAGQIGGLLAGVGKLAFKMEVVRLAVRLEQHFLEVDLGALEQLLLVVGQVE